jgi:hypothetical protein
MSNTNKENSNWIDTKWRPAMGWQYLVVCLFDFVIGPVMHVAYATYTKTPLVPWVPLTIQGGGLYHLAMGAVVGVNSWGRTKEKLAITEASAPADVAPEEAEPCPPVPKRTAK